MLNHAALAQTRFVSFRRPFIYPLLLPASYSGSSRVTGGFAKRTYEPSFSLMYIVASSPPSSACIVGS